MPEFLSNCIFSEATDHCIRQRRYCRHALCVLGRSLRYGGSVSLFWGKFVALQILDAQEGVW